MSDEKKASLGFGGHQAGSWANGTFLRTIYGVIITQYIVRVKLCGLSSLAAVVCRATEGCTTPQPPFCVWGGCHGCK